MIVLDTNVVSELMRRAPESGVVAWVDELRPSDVLITAVTVAELMYGVARLPNGRRKWEVQARVEGVLTVELRDQILPFDARAAYHYAGIVVARERTGRPIGMADAQIAAICRTWNAGLASRHVDDFAETGIEVVNPWDSPAL